jgi:hypothetical protein
LFPVIHQLVDLGELERPPRASASFVDDRS